ncbi:MAG: UDP-N-acetylglucosamine diphosphorylase / glucose-phosphate thymidylyltransferase [Archaeoglobaceae archaeon]|nr:UDP-N-acetylglucosamine diphosphorylase / glucose-phosphate thymidylyltransferase [Archaeoglobaceae archaeon]
MKAVILAAGKGERLQPLTDCKPKAMLPICNKPLIDYQIEALKSYGIDEIAVVAGYLEDELRRHLNDVKFYRDEKIKGTASALLAARNFIDDEFILVYGDVFFDAAIDDLIKTNNSMAVFEASDVSSYGEVIFENGKLVSIREKKSSGKGFVNAGIYHFDPSILDFAEKTEESERGEYELTDSIMMLNERKSVKVFPLNGFWSDVGYPWDYLDVNMYMLNKIGFSIGENTEIWSSATIRKPAVIGSDCEIKNCVVERSVIGNECVVGEFSVVKRSVVMSRSNVPHLNYVADSVISEGCNLGAGTKIANLRFDEKSIKMNVKGKRVDSGRRKLGAFIGYNVKTGINVSIYPGVKLGSDSWIEAEVLVRRDVERGSFVRKI